MMKHLIKILFSLFLVSLLVTACGKQSSYKNVNKNSSDTLTVKNEIEKPDLVIWCYDSLGAKNGFATKAVKLFKEDCKINAKLVTKGNTEQLVYDTIYSSSYTYPDIILGADNIHFQILADANILYPYKSKNNQSISRKYKIDRKYRLTAFDYGYYGFIYDSYFTKNPPNSFGTMQDGRWKKKFILVNPEKCPLGKSLLLYTVACCGTSGYRNFWRAFKENILSTKTNFVSAAKLFFDKKGSFLLSYSTFPAYLQSIGYGKRYKAFIPQEGAFMQIEGAGILKKSQNKENAKKFIDFLLTEKCQRLIPESQWLYPVLKKVELPESFKGLPMPTKNITNRLTKKNMYEFLKLWQDTWKRVMEKRQTLP